MEITKARAVSLDETNKTSTLSTLKNMYNVVGEVYNLLADDGLTEDMRNTLLFLIESYTKEISERMGYDSIAIEEINKRFSDTRILNKRIMELESALAGNVRTDGLSELFKKLNNSVCDWWRELGFNLVTDTSFNFYGYKARFCLDIRSLSFSYRMPNGDRDMKNRFEEMVEEGYNFIEDSGDYTLLDTENNRNLIMKVLEDKFPSIEIVSWENWKVYKGKDFKLRSLEAYIRNLNDLL